MRVLCKCAEVMKKILRIKHVPRQKKGNIFFIVIQKEVLKAPL